MRWLVVLIALGSPALAQTFPNAKSEPLPTAKSEPIPPAKSDPLPVSTGPCWPVVPGSSPPKGAKACSFDLSEAQQRAKDAAQPMVDLADKALKFGRPDKIARKGEEEVIKRLGKPAAEPDAGPFNRFFDMFDLGPKKFDDAIRNSDKITDWQKREGKNYEEFLAACQAGGVCEYKRPVR